MRMKKMNEKRENIVGVLAIHIPVCSHPIDILGVLTVFLKEEENFNFSHFRRKLKFQLFKILF